MIQINTVPTNLFALARFWGVQIKAMS